VLLWIAWILLLGMAGFLLGFLIGTPLVARGVRWRKLALIGVVAFLAYDVLLVIIYQESDASGLVVLSPLQLFGWFAGTGVALWIVRHAASRTARDRARAKVRRASIVRLAWPQSVACREGASTSTFASSRASASAGKKRRARAAGLSPR
jgi:predicted MFS family arabinose efflux permease